MADRGRARSRRGGTGAGSARTRRSGSEGGGATRTRRPASARRRSAAAAAAGGETTRTRLRRGLAAKRASGAAKVLGMSTTRRAAVVAIVVCALAFTVAVPLRTYLSQRSEVREQEAQQAQLQAQVDELRAKKAKLSDPAEIEAEARRRLRYVKPGESPYIVQLPEDQPASPPPAAGPASVPQGSWYDKLWDQVSGG
ncbi:septum formation initiator family protein [Amycolatopsis sp. NPDC051903]|uniref:septum formation initiator family protein n=1 Tax=Amycolatopsis sp. NPDC051903 TaxID=3363936 RepID=UPI0037B81FA2